MLSDMFYNKQNFIVTEYSEMFINQAFAQEAAEAASASGSLSGMILQLVLIFAIFYLLLIRPQQKRLKEHEAKVKALRKGDEIITGGGIIAKVAEINDLQDELKVEIASGTIVRIARSTVREVLTGEEMSGSNNKPKAKNKK